MRKPDPLSRASSVLGRASSFIGALAHEASLPRIGGRTFAEDAATDAAPEVASPQPGVKLQSQTSHADRKRAAVPNISAPVDPPSRVATRVERKSAVPEPMPAPARAKTLSDVPVITARETRAADQEVQRSQTAAKRPEELTPRAIDPVAHETAPLRSHAKQLVSGANILAASPLETPEREKHSEATMDVPAPASNSAVVQSIPIHTEPRPSAPTSNVARPREEHSASYHDRPFASPRARDAEAAGPPTAAIAASGIHIGTLEIRIEAPPPRPAASPRGVPPFASSVMNRLHLRGR